MDTRRYYVAVMLEVEASDGDEACMIAERAVAGKCDMVACGTHGDDSGDDLGDAIHAMTSDLMGEQSRA